MHYLVFYKQQCKLTEYKYFSEKIIPIPVIILKRKENNCNRKKSKPPIIIEKDKNLKFKKNVKDI